MTVEQLVSPPGSSCHTPNRHTPDNMTTYRSNVPVDSKKEEFRKYLEKSGVFSALTKALTSLYDEPQRPEDALSYVKARLDVDTTNENVRALKRELDETAKKLEILQLEHSELKSQMTREGVEIAVEPEH